MSSELKLAPCPFCGGEAQLHSAGGGERHWVECNDDEFCATESPYASSPESAAFFWNQRPLEVSRHPSRNDAKSFDEWLSETEGYGTRAERLTAPIDELRAAFEAGQSVSRNDVLEEAAKEARDQIAKYRFATMAAHDEGYAEKGSYFSTTENMADFVAASIIALKDRDG